MDDFHVGSIPSADPYGHRRPIDAVKRRRQPRQDGEQQDEAADTFEPMDAASDDQPDASTESIEDYYLPSDPSSESE
jgi:hypothetical protein